MCGIAVIVHKKKIPVSIDLLRQMTDIIQHRGPDGDGFHIDQHIGLGHRRLSIIDLSTDADQPFQIDNLWITYNGELFNYIELRKELQQLGHNFNTASDTEVLLRAYLQWGKSCVHRFNGMWAFVIYNKKNRTLFCSRDRYGIKPFYYLEHNDTLYIASEIKQFSCIPSWTPTINQPRLYDFLHYGKINHTNETLFVGVMSLPKGSHLIYDLDRASYSIERYYNLKEHIAPTNDTDGRIEHFNHLLKDAVHLRLRSDVKIGVSLSGGLDSSCISAITARELPDLHSFSIVYGDKYLSEQKYIDAFLKMYSIKNTSISPSFEDAKKHLKKTAWHLDQPMTSIGDVIEYLLYQKQSEQGIKVSLAGQGADEILAGYFGFYRQYFHTLVRNGKFYELFRFLIYASSLNAYSRDFFTQSFKSSPAYIQNLPIQTLVSEAKPTSILDHSLVAMDTVELLLFYEDRSSMAHSIESRQPFMDHRLVEFCLQLPDDLKIKHGKRKYILTESMKDLLPKEIYNRKNKLGYVTPQKRWIFSNRTVLINKIENSSLRSLLQTSFFSDMRSCPIEKFDDALIIRLISTLAWMENYNMGL